MALCPPPHLRHTLPFVSRRRALRSVAAAVALGAVLVLPTALHRDAGPRAPLAVVEACPESSPEAMSDLNPDGGLSQGLPRDFPDNWRRAPCPPSKTRRVVRGACFTLLAERPPCADGYEEKGECLAPLMAAKPFPSTIGR